MSAAVEAYKVFVGYDEREDIAYQVCRHSLLKRASVAVEVIPIKQAELRRRGLYWRERNNLESTEFSFTRFLTPYLSDFRGWSLFVDCDFLYLDDVKSLFDLADDRYALMCVHHDYTPAETTKMDGAVQSAYPRKNWSSMVLYNCGHAKNRVLSPEVVNGGSGAYLHRFQWLEDSEIGEIPYVWNFLVGHNRIVGNWYPKAVHYTLGGPWFDEWKDCEFGELWLAELQDYEDEQRKTKTKTMNIKDENVQIHNVAVAKSELIAET
ncbi:protein CDI-like [Andrographis paniculata]|uniref:protein CDI-like n=1 Tax=Andrographis paniculata TaxID=175694 RepID=UPI0021E76C5B|nr:protein CDI-like [Andrographis paniculata]XP_051147850.1 protein CDI-like [Andrographis paniculata]